MDKIDWTEVGALVAILYLIAFLVSIYYLRKQLKEMQKSTIAMAGQLEEARKSANTQSLVAIDAKLSDESLRKDRRYIFNDLKTKPFEQWTPEDRESVERACIAYDIVAIMVRYEMLPKEIIVDSWGDSMTRLWPIVHPLVKKYRHERLAPEIWDDFEWLQGEAAIFRASRKTQ